MPGQSLDKGPPDKPDICPGCPGCPGCFLRIGRVVARGSSVRNPCLDAALAELAKAGIRDPVIVPGGKHLQVRWTSSGGQARMLAVPGTPSDWRSAQNTRHDVRRILRADGMLEVPEPRSASTRQPSRIELLERRLAEVERRLGIGRN